MRFSSSSSSSSGEAEGVVVSSARRTDTYAHAIRHGYRNQNALRCRARCAFRRVAESVRAARAFSHFRTESDCFFLCVCVFFFSFFFPTAPIFPSSNLRRTSFHAPPSRVAPTNARAGREVLLFPLVVFSLNFVRFCDRGA